MNTGLIFDAGQYTVKELNLRIWEYAQNHGFVAVDATHNCGSCIEEIADKAIEWLNDTLNDSDTCPHDEDSMEQGDCGMWYGFGDNAEGFGLWDSEKLLS